MQGAFSGAARWAWGIFQQARGASSSPQQGQQQRGDGSNGAKRGVVITAPEATAWPDEGSRPALISRTLARLSAVGSSLLELAEDDGDAPDPADSSSLEVPGVPGAVPSAGVTALDSWARSQPISQEAPEPSDSPASSDALIAGPWLSRWLADHAGPELAAAAQAADFLGCQAFTQLYVEVQLLRVALLPEADLLRPAGRWGARRELVLPPLARLTEADFDKLPRQQRHYELQRVERERGQAQGSAEQQQPGSTSDPGRADSRAAAGQAQGQGQAQGEGARDGGATRTAEQEWDDWYRQPDHCRAPSSEPGSGDGADEAGDAGQPSSEPPGDAPPGLPPRHLAPGELEALVAGVVGGNMLRATSATEHDVRVGLWELGLTPLLSAGRQDAATVTQRRAPYLRLPLEIPGAAGGGGGAAAASAVSAEVARHYEVERVTMEAEAHDQGWSSFPEDHNTTRNSWTWGEVVLLGPGGAPVRPGEPPRAFTNLHAVERWQTHTHAWGPETELVQDLNRLVFAPGPRAEGAAGGSGRGEVAEGAGGGGSGGVEAGEQQAEQGGEAQGGGHQLVLVLGASFPGWRNFVRRGQLTVHLRPRGLPSAGGAAAAAAGGG
ncbi:hypothetical protein HYH03_000416 [Edaphochlamys debaryana]|uniref:Uncharacterized protein n=1 Tax=Edaphochlamys debaryana TaxID=47281 RepID=A0A835YFS8_9CHLO|nr:hypothetical protein HYH03_000416 [Edaphochlamys debaryana]|eukprot:KAG2501918.1 hypothetical protein HYH03_000416 [Edaphochlamys debaryana]